MKRYCAYLTVCLMLAACCGCNGSSSDTRFLLDTIVTITADCDNETLSGAFEVCEKYDDLFNARKETSEISTLNRNGSGEVSPDTAYLIETALYCSEISDGGFDITVYPLTLLWNFKNEIVPDKDEIAEALKSVDYGGVKLSGRFVDLCGRKIDLGGIAKGFIADKTLEYLKEKGAKSGIINLGGNVYVFGDKTYNVGIQTPFDETKTSAVIRLKNKTAATSGVYQRYFEKGGVLYHHIIDTKTGYPVESDLLSATVICDNSALADAFSTLCVIKGKKAAEMFIEEQKGVEAIFIDKDYAVSYTKGIKKQGEYLILK